MYANISRLKKKIYLPVGKDNNCSENPSLSDFRSNIALCRAVINLGSFGLIFLSSSST